MALTRGTLLDRVQAVTGENSTESRTFLETSFNHVLNMFYDIHDWGFKHKTDTFNTVAGTESYDLLTVGANDDIRSANDVEMVYDKTNGNFLTKVDMRDIRKGWPKEDTSGKPTAYAAWGDTTIFLTDEPDGIYQMKFLYCARAPESTADADTLVTTLGIPRYFHYLVEKLMMSEAFLYYDDNRRAALLAEIGSPTQPGTLIFNAIAADMKNLESTARFKFWEEELAPSGTTFNDFLRRAFSSND